MDHGVPMPHLHAASVAATDHQHRIGASLITPLPPSLVICGCVIHGYEEEVNTKSLIYPPARTYNDSPSFTFLGCAHMLYVYIHTLIIYRASQECSKE